MISTRYRGFLLSHLPLGYWVGVAPSGAVAFYADTLEEACAEVDGLLA